MKREEEDLEFTRREEEFEKCRFLFLGGVAGGKWPFLEVTDYSLIQKSE